MKEIIMKKHLKIRLLAIGIVGCLLSFFSVSLFAQTNTAALVGWWLFDEADGTLIYDYSENDNYAEILSPSHVERKTYSLVGSALWFDESTSWNSQLVGTGYVASDPIADQLYNHGFSVSAWIFPESTMFYTPIVLKVTDTEAWDDGWGIYIEYPNYSIAAFANGYWNPSLVGDPCKTGVWTHVCLTFDGANARLYINGQLRVSKASASNNTLNDAPVTVGTVIGWETWRYHGAIADVRVYDSALSTNEVFSVFAEAPVASTVDSLGQGFPDLWALSYGLDPFDPTLASQVLFADGLTILQKYRFGMNPIMEAYNDPNLLHIYTPTEKR